MSWTLLLTGDLHAGSGTLETTDASISMTLSLSSTARYIIFLSSPGSLRIREAHGDSMDSEASDCRFSWVCQPKSLPNSVSLTRASSLMVAFLREHHTMLQSSTCPRGSESETGTRCSCVETRKLVADVPLIVSPCRKRKMLVSHMHPNLEGCMTVEVDFKLDPTLLLPTLKELQCAYMCACTMTTIARSHWLHSIFVEAKESLPTICLLVRPEYSS